MIKEGYLSGPRADFEREYGSLLAEQFVDGHLSWKKLSLKDNPSEPFLQGLAKAFSLTLAAGEVNRARALVRQVDNYRFTSLCRDKLETVLTDMVFIDQMLKNLDSQSDRDGLFNFLSAWQSPLLHLSLIRNLVWSPGQYADCLYDFKIKEINTDCVDGKGIKTNYFSKYIVRMNELNRSFNDIGRKKINPERLVWTMETASGKKTNLTNNYEEIVTLVQAEDRLNQDIVSDIRQNGASLVNLPTEIKIKAELNDLTAATALSWQIKNQQGIYEVLNLLTFLHYPKGRQQLYLSSVGQEPLTQMAITKKRQGATLTISPWFLHLTSANGPAVQFVCDYLAKNIGLFAEDPKGTDEKNKLRARQMFTLVNNLDGSDFKNCLQAKNGHIQVNKNAVMQMTNFPTDLTLFNQCAKLLISSSA